MKTRIICAAIASALSLSASLNAAVTILDTAYSYSTHYTHSVSSSAITSFDWGSSSELYYQTSTVSYTFGGFYNWDGASQSTLVSGNTSTYPGSSVLRINNSVYFNLSDTSNNQLVRKYGPLSGSPSVSEVATTHNWGLYGRNAGEMFITGAVGFGTNQIFRAELDASGNFTASPVSLGTTIGSSGPIAFDASGNMYYAPGYYDTKIYKYTAADVAAAIADPTNNPLPSAETRLWYDYSANFTVGGGTGMAFDAEGNLLLTLTDFINPSYLVRFDVGGSGAFGGYEAILSSTDRLGDVRFEGGSIYLANSNTILNVVPEPGTWVLMVSGCASLILFRRQRTAAQGSNG